MAAIHNLAGAPAAGTDEVQTVTITGSPTGGTFKLSFYGKRTAAIAHNANAAAVVSALEALPNIAAGDVTGGGGPLPTLAVTVTFAQAYAKTNVPALAVADNSLTGGTTPAVSVAVTTPGVEASARHAKKGDLLSDTTNGVLYINTGSDGAPTWTKVGTQS